MKPKPLTVRSWAIVETTSNHVSIEYDTTNNNKLPDTPSELVGARDDIVARRVSAARPPAALLGLRRSLRVARAAAVHGRGDIRNVDTVELLQPLLHLGRVCKFCR